MSQRDSAFSTTGQLPLLPAKSDVSSFENFLLDVASSNGELLALLKQMIEQGVPSPYFLYGMSGAGKTHLLSATMRLLQQKKIHNSFYFDLRNAAITPQFIRHLEQPEFVCIDNLEAWAGNSEGEQALFSIIERAKQQAWPILVSAQQKPGDLGLNLADLVSRLNSGVVYGLSPLDDETKFAALKLRAKARGLVIQDDAIRYLLTHYARNNKTLFATIDRLDKASLVAKRKVTVPFLQQVLSTSS